MAKFKFYMTICEHGIMEVEAETFDEAKGKAEDMNGTFHDYNTEILDINLIGE